jgi:hypothetical protein
MSSFKGVNVQFKLGVSFLGKDSRKFRYAGKNKKIRTVQVAKTERYHVIVKGSKYRYNTDDKYRSAVNKAVEQCKDEWDREFFCPDSKINKIV